MTKLHESIINSALSLSGTFITLKGTCSIVYLKGIQISKNWVCFYTKDHILIRVPTLQWDEPQEELSSLKCLPTLPILWF